MKKRLKRIAYDVAGVTLIIISPLLGWLPGPGGIPLFLAGLGLLAVHNDWAHELLQWAKVNAENFLEIIFPCNKKMELFHDFIGLSILSLALALFLNLDKPYSYIFPAMLTASGLFWVLYNRRRYKAIINFVKPNKHKH